jgi:hypothetical protein
MKANIVNLMEKALATNARRDKIERTFGFTANSDCDLQNQLRTVQLAIQAGLLTDDPNCYAEAGAMLASITGYYPWRDKQQVAKNYTNQ